MQHSGSEPMSQTTMISLTKNMNVISLWGGTKALAWRCTSTSWKVSHFDTLCRCQPVPWCLIWEVCHWYTSHDEYYTNWLVFQKTSYSGDCHLWLCVCCCQDLCRANYWFEEYSKIPWGTNLWEKLHVWWQQVCCGFVIKFHANLHKRHTALSFHHGCAAMASKYLGYYFLPNINSTTDILNKH